NKCYLLTQPTTARQASMPSSSPAPQLSDLHMIVLTAIAHQGHADAQDVAAHLGMPVEVVDTLSADLEAAGWLVPASTLIGADPPAVCWPLGRHGSVQSFRPRSGGGKRWRRTSTRSSDGGRVGPRSHSRQLVGSFCWALSCGCSSATTSSSRRSSRAKFARL